MNKWFITSGLAVLCAMAICADTVPAQQASSQEASEEDHSDLAKQSQNPIADMISLPFQWNMGFDTSPDNHTGSVLNIQPVIPFHLNADWNVITHKIVPLVNQPLVGSLQGKGI